MQSSEEEREKLEYETCLLLLRDIVNDKLVACHWRTQTSTRERDREGGTGGRAKHRSYRKKTKASQQQRRRQQQSLIAACCRSFSFS